MRLKGPTQAVVIKAQLPKQPTWPAQRWKHHCYGHPSFYPKEQGTTNIQSNLVSTQATEPKCHQNPTRSIWQCAWLAGAHNHPSHISHTCRSQFHHTDPPCPW
eukprot:11980527-Ditylum_brightwellii.AAC.2